MSKLASVDVTPDTFIPLRECSLKIRPGKRIQARERAKIPTWFQRTTSFLTAARPLSITYVNLQNCPQDRHIFFADQISRIVSNVHFAAQDDIMSKSKPARGNADRNVLLSLRDSGQLTLSFDVGMMEGQASDG